MLMEFVLAYKLTMSWVSWRWKEEVAESTRVACSFEHSSEKVQLLLVHTRRSEIVMAVQVVDCPMMPRWSGRGGASSLLPHRNDGVSDVYGVLECSQADVR